MPNEASNTGPWGKIFLMAWWSTRRKTFTKLLDSEADPGTALQDEVRAGPGSMETVMVVPLMHLLDKEKLMGLVLVASLHSQMMQRMHILVTDNEVIREGDRIVYGVGASGSETPYTQPVPANAIGKRAVDFGLLVYRPFNKAALDAVL